MSDQPMLAYVLSKLPRQGDAHFMARLEQIEKATGISIHTLIKIAKGETSDPRVSTVQQLYDHFKRQELAAA